jgi:large subunit ribosomal protein L23
MSVLKKPIISEKMALKNERPGNKQYAFRVDLDAAKPQIKNEIEAMYEVHVKTVRTMVVMGKKRSRYTRAGFISGKSSNFKKAIVTLAPGEEIDFYKNIQ